MIAYRNDTCLGMMIYVRSFVTVNSTTVCLYFYCRQSIVHITFNAATVGSGSFKSPWDLLNFSFRTRHFQSFVNHSLKRAGFIFI